MPWKRDFTSTGVARLSRLSVWWIRLGIQPLQIQPGHPEQNPRHERMHRTLKEETARPPALHQEGIALRRERIRGDSRRWSIRGTGKFVVWAPMDVWAFKARSGF